MEEIDASLVTQKSIRGIFALTSRTLVVQIISFVSSLLLTIFLSPSVFGVFFVVSAIIVFFSYFSDIGLAAALIQKKEVVTNEDLKTTFTIQQCLVLVLVFGAFILISPVANFYKLDASGIFLFQALIISFFLSSLKTIPSVILERSLNFDKLVIPQIIETIFFNITAVLLAINGFGITSFTIAVLARGFSGLLAIYIVSPWRIRIGFSRKSAKKLLSFGVPFQANSFLALLKDDLLIAYIGKVLPLSEVGFIGFAQKWAFTPLRLIMDNIIRITFPSFSRLQDEKEILGRGVEKNLFASSFLIFPSLVGLVLLSPYFVNLIPKYSKWEPALLSLSFFCLNAALSSVSTPLTNALNAIGKIKITLYLMIFWTISTWILTPLFIVLFGFNGVALASAVISLSIVIVILIVKKIIRFNLFDSIFYPAVSAFIMGAVLFVINPLFIRNFLSLGITVIFGAILYIVIMFCFARTRILEDLRL